MPNRHEITACILCSRNCGLDVQVGSDRFVQIRGDPQHPISEGYLCQKAARLDHYQNHQDRLTQPLRRRASGEFEPIAWETAIEEIAAKLLAIRQRYGGRAFATYGGGGQGNHLGGIYIGGIRCAMRSRFSYTALAQEKTGDFWVNDRLFGRQTCHVTEDIDHSDYVLFIGTNPWQAHGIRNARDTLRTLSKSLSRTMVVIDPRRTETAALADVHLQIRPGTDAFLLAAILAIWVRDDLVNNAFIERHTVGYDALRRDLLKVPIADFVARADVPLDAVGRVARDFASAKSACVRVDLGIQQSLHSTLNSYLEKLLFLLTGNFAKLGGNNLHTLFMPIIGHSDEQDPENWRTTVTGFPGIGKFYPPNALPEEIDTDHPERIRALLVDSANPVLTGADSKAYERAFHRLDLLVVTEVAMTETARLAHYVLPTSSQFEKWEATFFTLDFPKNGFQLRHPIFSPRGNTLPEGEIYRRLLVAMGELPADLPILRQIASLDRKFPKLRLYPLALGFALALRPKLRRHAAFVVAQTLGRTLAPGAEWAGPLWAAAHHYAKRHRRAVRRAGHGADGSNAGEALFAEILRNRSGVVLSVHEYADNWRFIRHADHRIHLEIPELLEQLRLLALEPDASSEFPFILIAGDRRSYNANTIYRDPAWRKTDRVGALHMHPADATELRLAEGRSVECKSAHGSISVRIAYDPGLRRGVLTLPHGYGMRYGDGATETGPAINRLTGASHRDPIAGTPFHKHVPVRLRVVQEKD